MGTRMRIAAPGDYVLRRDVCSYGHFLLAPYRWAPAEGAMHAVYELQNGPARVRVGQPAARGDRGPDADGGLRGRELVAAADRALDRKEQRQLRAAITRSMRLDEDEAAIAAFHRVDKRWEQSGRGRLFRGASFFEDLVKTVTGCNVAWPNTMAMNKRICGVFGPAFPSAARIAREKPATLRTRCKVGYRDRRIVALAELVAGGEIDTAWCQDPATSDEDLYAAMLGLPGIGPYAASNMMQMLGRYGRLAVDTETLRHARQAMGMEGSDKGVRAAVETHYRGFGEHRFRSYWFDLLCGYEAKRGLAAHLWDPETTGPSFTASKL